MATNRTNLQVGLQFSADTSQARRELQNLQKELNALGSSNSFGLQDASKAAMELAANLQTATNFETGKLDLSKFQKNLSQSGKSLKEYGALLTQLGPDGTRAFNSLTSAIMQAEVPLAKTNKLMSALWTSFKQTAKYQFTSSIYRNLIGGLRDAYSYAQDLNESLNNIRIVTGQSTDQMAKFAEEANKAAKQLSVTTTQYTNGALIYYQQGLNDEEVKARTDITMKLANASGVSAETASQQLTAIWNNFAKGSENLEYFADVMTALGASTASSTSEIAEGLEKFAAIGNTVGLSYEYAASALATVTATTRQSADVVGTAFKTLFARIQDLEVGETLEDGTTLGKYSQALATVGVNIKDANGELKAMDQILEEMAAAWSTISKDQQVALAQTVAGTRQYTQLVALMENWSFMQKNLQTSYDSTGTVQKQADIYTESWEAARAHVKASLEGLYASILDDQFFIDITNGIGKIINFIDETLKSLGGLKTILPTIISLVTTLFSNEIVSSMQNAVNRINDLTGATQRYALQQRQAALEAAKEQLVNEDALRENPNSLVARSGNQAYQATQRYFDAQEKVLPLMGKMSDYQLKQTQMQLDRLNLLREESVQLANQIEQQNDLINKEKQQNALITDNIKKRAETLYGNQAENYIENEESLKLAEIFNLEAGNKRDTLTWVNDILNSDRIGVDLRDSAEALRIALTSKKPSDDAIKQAFEKVIERIKQEQAQYEEALRDIGDEATNPKKNGQQAIEQFLKNYQTALSHSGGIARLQGYAEQMGKAAGESKVTDEDIEELKRVIEEASLSDDDKKKLSLEIEKLKDVSGKEFYEALGQKLKEIKADNVAAIDKAAHNINVVTGKTVTTDTTTQDAGEKIIGRNQAGLYIDSKKGEGINSLDFPKEDFVNTQQALTSLTSSLTAAAGAYNSLTNAAKVFSDENATAQQKITSLVGVLSSLGMTTMSLSRATSVLGKIKNGQLKIDKNSLFFARAQKLADVEGAEAKWGITAATQGYTMSLKGLMTVMKPFLIVAGSLLAIWGAIKLIKWISEADEREAKKATEQAKELADAYKEAKDAAQELKDNISNWDKAKEGLTGLTKGTEEYKKQLEEANDVAKEIIEKNKKELAGKWHYDVNGNIVFSDGALEELEESLGRSMSEARVKSIEAENKANQANLKASLTALVRSDGNGTNNRQREVIEELSKIYLQNQQNYGEAISALSKNDRELIKDLDIEPYLQEVYQHQQEGINYNRELTLDFIKYHKDWNDYYSGLKEDGLEKEIFVDLVDQFSNVTLEEQKKQVQNDWIVDTSELLRILSVNELWETNDEIVKILRESNIISDNIKDGLEATDKAITLYGEEIAVRQQDNTFRFLNNATYNGATGNLEFQNDIADIVVAHLNATKPQELSVTAKGISDELLKIFTKENDAINFFQGIKSGQGIDYSALNSEKAEKLYNALNNENSQIYKYYENYFKDDEKAYKQFKENIGKYYSAYTQQLQSFNNEVIGSSDKVLKEFFEGQFNKYSLEASKSIRDNLTQAFIAGGEAGEKNLAELLKNADDPLGILTVLNATDWRKANFDELYVQLKNIGLAIDKDTFKDFAEDLKQAADKAYILTSSLTELFKETKALKDIVDKLSFGSIISDEDYQKYIKDKAEFAGKFVWTVDGWMFVGDKDEISITNDNIEEIRNRYAQARADASNIKQEDLTKNNTELAKVYGGNNINETALGLTNYNGQTISKEALETALNKVPFFRNNEDKKIIEEYGAALRKLKETEKDYADNNVLTAHVQLQYKSIDQLNKDWKELTKTWEGAEEISAQLVKIAAINEAASKGINKEELVDYANYLRTVNKDLANNEELLYQVAVANKVAEKAWKDTISTYEADIDSLLHNGAQTDAYRQSLERMRQNLADMLSIPVEELKNLDVSFFTQEETIALYKAIAENDKDALYKLTADAMERAGFILESEKTLYIQFQEFLANNPTQAQIDAWITLHGEGAELFTKNTDGTYKNITALDAAGMEFDNSGNYTSQPDIRDYNAVKKDKSGKSKTLKSLDDEIDRYHYIRKLLADIERELDRVGKAKERAYGAQHLKYIEQETDYLREQVGLQDRYINEIEGYLAKDRGLIAAYGAQFDQFGNISNYNQLFTSNFNKYANAEDSTNWENFKKALSKYEETLDLWFEQTEEKAELLRQILDKQLEGISYKVEVEVALDDREIALLEHQLNRLDDAAYDTAAALANIGEQFKNTEDSIKSTTNGIVDVLKTIPGITQDQINRYLAGDGDALAGLHIEQGQIELLEQYSDQLLELSDRLKELHDSALQKVTEAFDAWGEKIEDHVAKFEHLNNVLNNYEEIIGILGRNNLGISNEFMRAMRNQEITNLQSILNTRTQTKDVLTAQLADARQKASEAATEAEREDWEQIVTDLEGRLREATESWQQAWIDALQANKEAFEQTMQELVDSFDDYADELKRYDTAEDRYLETYRQAYELSKLGRDIQNSINDQDSIRAKKELQKLEDKINALKESGRAISENELGLLQKEYELRLAEIALEDAQNAKSLVRLERDNEGNWGYVYTADQENIEKARQDYEDKLYEYMRLADTMAEESSRAILTLNKEMAEALAALDTDAEDYEAKVAEITQFYADQINYFAEQYGISVDAITNVARESAAKYKPEVVDIIDSDNSGLQTNFAETVLAIIGDFEDLEDAIAGPDGALPNIQRAYTETLAAFEDYRVQNARTCELAGVDIKTLSGLMQDEFDSIKEKADSIDASTKTMTDTMSSYLSGVLNSFNEFATNYSAKAKVINTANEALASSIIQLEKVLQNVDAGSLASLKKAADQVGMIAQKVKEVSNSADNDNESIKTGGLRVIKTSYEIKPGDMTYHYLVEYYSDGTTTKTTQRHRWVGGGAGEVCPECSAMRALNPNAYKNAPDYIKWVPVNFDTGGYTGEWGSTGRLAVLHEKELILNKEDTSNILDAVSLIRQMTAGTAQLSYGLGNIGAGLANLNLSPGTMDQNVNISASFPNVVNHNEIEEALTNLVNKASQYAFRPNLT